MMYYVEGNADKSVSPDVFVTVGIPKLPEREIYQVWREGKGPDVVIEVTSPTTARVDQRRKFDLYRDVLKVSEYFLFDPRPHIGGDITVRENVGQDGERHLTRGSRATRPLTSVRRKSRPL